ncbi:MAG TPA: hypothetical protein V6C78_20960 [Crinalium sp.]
MSAIAKRSSVSELTHQILEMGQTGVYRESVFEALAPLATKKQIRLAIAHAKKFGLHSVASLRDAELGTYYQVDVAKYQSLKHAITSSVVTDDEGDVVAKLVDVTLTVKLMLATAKGLAIALLVSGVACSLVGRQQLGLGLLVSAASSGGLWLLQKNVARKII